MMKRPFFWMIATNYRNGMKGIQIFATDYTN